MSSGLPDLVHRKERQMALKTFALAGLALAISSPAAAHHSFSMFQTDKTVTVSGVVKEFEMTNPHVWIRLMAPDATGKLVQWAFEMQSVNSATAAGWRPDTIKPGDKLSVDFHPLKDGTRGGQFISAVLADGKRLGMAHLHPGVGED
jgi:hypothetical protein